jgi:hypothetical protein
VGYSVPGLACFDKSQNYGENSIGPVAGLEHIRTGTVSALDSQISNAQGNFADQQKAQYYAQIMNFTLSNWVPVALISPENLEALFMAIIQPNGRISSKRLMRSSPNPGFDRPVKLAL